MRRDVAKWYDVIYDAICAKHESRNVFVSVLDESTTELIAFQVGGDMRTVFNHISMLMRTNARDAIIENMLRNVDDNALREIADAIESKLCDEYDDEEDGEDFESESFVSMESVACGDEPCKECFWFEEKKLGFGNCAHHPEIMDGEYSNNRVGGKQCIYYECRKER